MKRQKIQVTAPESENSIGIVDSKVVIRKGDANYNFDSSSSSDLSVNVINVLQGKLLANKSLNENTGTTTVVSSTERGTV